MIPVLDGEIFIISCRMLAIIIILTIILINVDGIFTNTRQLLSKTECLVYNSNQILNKMYENESIKESPKQVDEPTKENELDKENTTTIKPEADNKV
jgi:hypothetical protein